MRTFVKICGITDPAILSEIPYGGGAGFLIGAPESPRSLTVEQVPPLIDRLPNGVEAWGVVVDPTAELIHRLYDEAGVDRIQVYGPVPSGLEFLEIHHLVPSLPVAPEGTPGSPPTVPPAEDYPRLHLDAAGTPWVSGSLLTPDWSVCASLVDAHPGRKFTLAGGLSPENVAEALTRVRPWGIDLAAGVESAPGRKEVARIRALLTAVDAYEKELLT